MQRQSDHPRFRVRTHTHSKGLKLTSQIPLAYTFFLLPLSLVPTICPPTGLALGCIFRHVILFVLPFFQKVSLITSVFCFFFSFSLYQQTIKKKYWLYGEQILLFGLRKIPNIQSRLGEVTSRFARVGALVDTWCTCHLSTLLDR